MDDQTLPTPPPDSTDLDASLEGDLINLTYEELIEEVGRHVILPKQSHEIDR